MVSRIMASLVSTKQTCKDRHHDDDPDTELNAFRADNPAFHSRGTVPACGRFDSVLKQG